MTEFGDKWAPIYINGIKCMATIGLWWENSFDGLFYADTDDLPARLEYTSKADHQFQQALNILKGLQIMQNK